jgi:hypothetical protein
VSERPLEVPELAILLVRMEHAVHETSAGMRRGMYLVSGLFAMFTLIGALVRAWPIAIVSAPFAIGIALLGRVAARKTSPERMRPVFEAMRDAPDRIVYVRHYQTSDSRRLFVTDWLEIKTADHRLVMKAKDDWARLLDYARRRCPNAKIA